MSFFDEDDEPLRTTARTRARSTPPPRRGRPVGGGGGAGSQQVLVRRMVAVGLGAILLLGLILLVRACNDSRHKNALREYNRQVTNIGTQSAQTGSGFFKVMQNGDGQSPQALYQQILSYKEQAEASLKQAQQRDAPEDMKAAHQSLLIALELRRDGLTAIAGDIKTALGDEGDAADKAIGRIAGQMQAFDASDVLYRARVVPFIQDALKDAEIGGEQRVLLSQFMREINWVSPQYVAARLGQQLSTGGEGGTGTDNQPTGPGLHGTGLDATSYGTVTLQPGASNRLTYATGTPFTVAFTNQGDNDEFNIKVTLQISRETGSPITINKTVPRVAKGEKATVALPLNRTPPLDTVVNIKVTVNAVPGEKKKDNNTATYPSLFVRG